MRTPEAFIRTAQQTAAKRLGGGILHAIIEGRTASGRMLALYHGRPEGTEPNTPGSYLILASDERNSSRRFTAAMTDIVKTSDPYRIIRPAYNSALGGRSNWAILTKFGAVSFPPERAGEEALPRLSHPEVYDRSVIHLDRNNRAHPLRQPELLVPITLDEPALQ